MDALMRNDWPEENSGIQTAFAFAMPLRVDEMLAGQYKALALSAEVWGMALQHPCGLPTFGFQARAPVSAARAWDAHPHFVSVEQFVLLLREPMYAPLLNCTHWELASPMVFHGKGDLKALQAVKVTSGRAQGGERLHTYTFCLEKVASGAYKDCWMVVGMRVGDYANV
eukprot:SM000018S03586  [mRNA]  locus=s18:118881:120244:- [translate_table: standard]